LHGFECTGSGSAKAGDPPFLFRDDFLRIPYATLSQCEGIVVRHYRSP